MRHRVRTDEPHPAAHAALVLLEKGYRAGEMRRRFDSREANRMPEDVDGRG